MKTFFRTFILLSTVAVSPPLLMAESSYVALSATRDVFTDDSSVEIRYSVSVPETLENHESDIKKFTMPGFGMEIAEGKPLLPVRIDYVEIPTGCEYSVTTELSDSLVFSCDIEPAQPLMTDSDVKNPDFVGMDNYPGFYPRMNVEGLTPQIYRDRSIAPIRVCPMRYSQESKTLIIYRKISYKVEFDQGNSAKQALANKDFVHSVDETFNNFVISHDIANDEDLTRSSLVGNRSNLRRAPDYLVLTTSDYENLLEHDFLPWRQKMGFNVHIAADDSWTPDKIKETVKSYYSQYPTLEYLLLFGNNRCVPAYSRFHGYDRQNYVTDYPYVCMDGDDDLLADIYCGRIPVDNIEEAHTVINNIIRYERYPSEDEDFYNTGVHVIDNSTLNGEMNKRFTGAASDISEYLSSNFNKSIIHDGSPSGGFYVLYRGHGYNDGWSNPTFKTEDISSLDNFDNMPFVFNLTCYTGQFGAAQPTAPYEEVNCFAKELLTYSNGGCIISYSSSWYGSTPMNEGLSKGIFNAIWPSPGLYMTLQDTYGADYNANFSRVRYASYRAGQILEQAKKTLSEYYLGRHETYENPWSYACETIHCFGDPTVMIYTEQPSKISSKPVLAGSYLTFDDDVTCVYRASVSGDIYLSNGSSPVPSGYTFIAAVAHNSIPYIPNIITPLSETFVSEVTITSTDSDTLDICYSGEPGSIAETAVYDIFGNRKNVTSDISINNVSINVRNLSKGIYMLSVTMRDGRVITKSFTR